MSNKVLFCFRANTEQDSGYILKSWLKTWRSERSNEHMSESEYYQQAHGLFTSILNKYGAVIACNPDMPEQIYAFAITAYLPNNEWALFWIQTKAIYKGLGIGKGLYKFIRNNNPSGPICPFVRTRSRKYMDQYDVLDAPYALPNILNSPIINSPAKELDE